MDIGDDAFCRPEASTIALYEKMYRFAGDFGAMQASPPVFYPFNNPIKGFISKSAMGTNPS